MTWPSARKLRDDGCLVFPLVIVVVILVSVVFWPILFVLHASRCRNFRQRIAGSLAVMNARRDDASRWTVFGRDGQTVQVNVAEVLTARWVVFDEGVRANPVEDAESWLFALELRHGGTLRLFDAFGQLEDLRAELASTGVLLPAQRVPGCREGPHFHVLGVIA